MDRQGSYYPSGVVSDEAEAADTTPAEYPPTTPAGQSHTIADELRAWRGRLGLSQPAAADALRLPVKTLRGWEGGKEPANPGLLRVAMELLLERSTSVQPAEPASAPKQTKEPTAAAHRSATSPAHNIPQTLSRPTVEPFFRPSGKGRSKG